MQIKGGTRGAITALADDLPRNRRSGGKRKGRVDEVMKEGGLCESREEQGGAIAALADDLPGNRRGGRKEKAASTR